MASTSERITKELRHRGASFAPTANNVFYAGTLAGLKTSTGLALPGQADNELVAIGVVRQTYDNRAGAQPNNLTDTVQLDYGIREFKINAATTNASVGALVYVVDNDTVSISDGAGARPVCGKIFSVSSSTTVFVDLDAQF